MRHASFERVAKVTVDETPAADGLYKDLGKHAHSPALKALADDFYEHENALRDWLRSELDGRSDGGGKVFAYLERHGMSREEAVIPRKNREDLGGDTQELVLAFFDTEDAADEAARALRDWEKASEYMQVDAIGVLVKDADGQVKEHKLGRRVAQLPRVTQEPRPPTLDQVRPPNARHAADANADDTHRIHPLRVMRGAGA